MPFFIIAAVALIGLAFLFYKATTDAVSDVFTGPVGIGVAVAVVIIAGTAAWHRLQSKQPKGRDSSSEPKEPKP